MRNFLYLMIMTFGVVFTSQAQTTPQAKKPTKEAPQKAPSETAPAETEKKPVDLDSYFKNGEENAKNSSCDKPAEPTNPIA